MKIGCSKCRQESDYGCEVSRQEYDAGWIGKVETRLMLCNAPEHMCADESWEDNDRATLYFSLWKIEPEVIIDKPLVSEDYEIKYCPFCGANLKEVRDYMRQIESDGGDVQ